MDDGALYLSLCTLSLLTTCSPQCDAFVYIVKLIEEKYELQLTLEYTSFLLASKHIQHISSHSYIIWVPYTLIQDQVSKYLGISLPFLEIMSSNNLFVVQSSKYYIMKRIVSTLKLQYVTIERYRSISF